MNPDAAPAAFWPSPSMDRTRFLLLLVILTPVACDSETRTAFAATALASGDGKLYRNQNIEIVFNRPLATGFQASEALQLRDDRGEAVPFRMRSRGSLLSLAPLDPRGWPASRSLDLRILFPYLGTSLRSADGEENGALFERRIELDAGYLRRPGVLRLLEHDVQGLERRPLDAERPIRLVFSAPLDPASLRTGIQVFALERARKARRMDSEVRLAEDAPNVAIIPVEDSQGTLWRAGLDYEIHLTRQLSSLDGRHLLDVRSDRLIRLRTAQQSHGTLVIRFDDDEDVVPEHRGALRGNGQLEPVALGEALFDSRTGKWESFQELFGREASRAQIVLAPPYHLPKTACVIEAVHFHLHAPLSSTPVAGLLRVSMAYLNDDAALEWSFEANEARMVGARQITLNSAGGLGLPGSTVLSLKFRRPFVYDGSGRRLVLELRRESRFEDTAGLPMVLAVQGRSGEPDSAPAMLLRSGDTDTKPLPTSFRPRMIVQTKRTTPVVTRWYELQGVRRPHFERQPDRDKIGTAVEGDDFVIYYQSGFPDSEGGYVPFGGWSIVPPSGAAPAVRLKIEFLPGILCRDGAPRGIESVLLHYKDDQRRSPR